MSNKNRKNAADLVRVIVFGTTAGLILGWFFGDIKVAAVVGALVSVSLFILERVRLAPPIDELVPFAPGNNRRRTKVDRLIEPFLCAVVGAAYGGIFCLLSGEQLAACLVEGGIFFFFIDFVYLYFWAPNK